MALPKYITFNKHNQQMITVLFFCHLIWGLALVAFCSVGQRMSPEIPWLTAIFLALQLYSAAQLLLPALLLEQEKRSRGFYFFWFSIMVLTLLLINKISIVGIWQLPLVGVKSGLLLFTGTLIGTVLARFVNKLWEVIPICIAMALADLFSWWLGPTANFAKEIEQYYLAPVGSPPLIDIVLVKLALPNATSLVPVFGISDWIMVAFFVNVSQHYAINDNLLGLSGAGSATGTLRSRYLPVAVVALFTAVILAQSSGLFIPVLPLIATMMLLWYAVHQLRSGQSTD
ncbi:hypothetical protein [Desulfuromusa kysingii]|nr:hypothetical protein [Desulfuromusa kysingii]